MTNDDILALYYKSRAQEVIKNFVIPAVKQAVIHNTKQDVSSCPESQMLVSSIYGAAMEDERINKSIN